MIRRSVRALYHMIPPKFWRSIDGLKEDFCSLPHRIKDTSRRQEPWQFIHHVGGDFFNTGNSIINMLYKFGGLKSDYSILDIGCGNGRAAWPLTKALDINGKYLGFDVSKSAVKYCSKNISSRFPNFSFRYLDIINGIYNPQGSIAGIDVKFPAPDSSVDLAFATSVFTHLSWPDVLHYLQETGRVLRPGGTALLTAFILNEESLRWIELGESTLPFQVFNGQTMTSDPHWPENAMAYPEKDLVDAIQGVGLRIDDVLSGNWRPSAQYEGGQDLLVVRKPIL